MRTLNFGEESKKYAKLKMAPADKIFIPTVNPPPLPTPGPHLCLPYSTGYSSICDPIWTYNLLNIQICAPIAL